MRMLCATVVATVLAAGLLGGGMAVAACVGGAPDGVQEGEEQCDDGNLACGDACDPDCTVPGCGNGFTCADTGEACDDGNTANCDGCEGNCTLPACGNGIQCPPEQCDDGNTTNCDGCEGNCTLPACGNGVQCFPEQCDDGNTKDCDGCDGNCTFSACGNGVTCRPEQCDDGNTNDFDGCTNSCTVAECLPLPEWSAGAYRGTIKLPSAHRAILPPGLQPGGVCPQADTSNFPTTCPDLRPFVPAQTYTFLEPGFCYDPLDPNVDVVLAAISVNVKMEARHLAEEACRDACESTSCASFLGKSRSCVARTYKLGGSGMNAYDCIQRVCAPNPFGGAADTGLRYYQCVANVTECRCRCAYN
jgi:cysteine-rich repeat protein